MKLKELGAEVVVPVGLGDDQNDDGYDGALTEWEPALWEALEVTVVEERSQAERRRLLMMISRKGATFSAV